MCERIAIELPSDVVRWAEEAGVPVERLVMWAVLKFREVSPADAFLNPSGD